MHIDPALFKDDAISEETQTFNSQLQQILTSLPRTSSQEPDAIRDARREGGSPWGAPVFSDHAREMQIDGPGGKITLRIIEIGEPQGVYLHLHGGGWVLGDPDLSDVGNEAMAAEANVATVSVGYRLAPEHKFPAGATDCGIAAEWLIENCLTEFGTDRLTIGGESAGANLAAGTLLHTKDLGYRGWRGANLVYGSFLPVGTPSVHQWKTDGLVLDSDTMGWFGDHYLKGTDYDVTDPALSPLYGDLSNMPPALFTIGTRDPLVDDTLFMAARWIVAGSEAELAVYPGGVHAFDAFPIAIAKEARDRMHRFVNTAVTNNG